MTRERRKAVERAIVLGEDDPFDYELALALGWSLEAVGALPHAEYIRWRAYWAWRANEIAHQKDVASMRARP